jgi:hypothetical protein
MGLIDRGQSGRIKQTVEIDWRGANGACPPMQVPVVRGDELTELDELSPGRGCSARAREQGSAKVSNSASRSRASGRPEAAHAVDRAGGRAALNDVERGDAAPESVAEPIPNVLPATSLPARNSAEHGSGMNSHRAGPQRRLGA